MDAMEQSGNRICYLWKNLKSEKTCSEITGKKTFSKGEVNLETKNKLIIFFFFYTNGNVFCFSKIAPLYFK